MTGAVDTTPRLTPSEALRLGELMVSRFAHELVGPVGAVSNGLELMDSLGAEADAEAAGLVARSAESVKARLQFYRAAYGRAGRDLAGLAEVRALCLPFFEAMQEVELDWPMAPVAPALADGEARLVLNLAALAADALPRGGRVEVALDEGAFTVTAVGDQPGFQDGLRAAMADDAVPAELDPRTVHGFIARRLAADCGRDLTVEAADGSRLVLSARRAASAA